MSINLCLLGFVSLICCDLNGIKAMQNKGAAKCPSFTSEACAESISQLKDILAACQDIINDKPVDPDLEEVINSKDGFKLVADNAASNLRTMKLMLKAVNTA